jgi:hypothetical protein
VGGGREHKHLTNQLAPSLGLTAGRSGEDLYKQVLDLDRGEHAAH